jgi:hypothetical protein
LHADGYTEKVLTGLVFLEGVNQPCVDIGPSNVLEEVMRLAAFLLACVLGAAALPTASKAVGAFSSHAVSGTSTWISSHGSVMVLDVADDGVVRGYYVNNAPGKGCRGIPYDLSGQLTDQSISFHVSWRSGVADCLTETQWRGHLQPSRNGGLEIVTEWQRTSTLAPFKKPKKAFEEGTDVFTLQISNGVQWRLGY